MAAETKQSGRKDLDLGVEVTERLMWVIDELPKRQRRRFRPAAQRAADALEACCPALMGATPHGMIAGLYSAVMPGRFALVLASAAKQILFTPELRIIPAALEDAEAFLDEAAKDWGYARESLPPMIEAVLEAESLTRPGLGFLLQAPEHRRHVETIAAASATPAFVGLLSSDGTGALRFVLPHGRTWPVLDLEDPRGHA